MTAARRALPAPPTALQRLAAWWNRNRQQISRTLPDPAHERLVSHLEDHTDRLDGYARRADNLGHHWIASTHRRNAADLRRILQEHS